MVNATALTCPATRSNDPKICYDYNTTVTMGDNLQNATLTGLSWKTNGSNILTPQTNGKDVAVFIFTFDTKTTTPVGSPKTETYEVTFGGSGGKQIIVLDAGDKGIALANQKIGNTTGQFYVNFGQTTSGKRQFHLNLSKTTGEFSFKGNIDITAGTGTGADEDSNSKFVGEFGKKVVGNITILRNQLQSAGKQEGHKTDLIFKNGASLEGDLITQAGQTTATFENGNITGNVIAQDHPPTTTAITKASNTITFKGNSQIMGGIRAISGGQKDSTSKNTITFEGDSTIGGDIATSNSNNDITIKGTAAIIGGKIHAGNGSNTIKADNATLTIGSTSRLADITVSEDNSSNTTNTIKAKNLIINAGSIGVKPEFKNTISKNEITITEEANITAQNIISKSGHSNALSAKTLTINVGSILAESTSGNTKTTENTITATSGNIKAETIEAINTANKITLQDGSISTKTLKTTTGLNSIKLNQGTFSAKSIEATGNGTNATNGINVIEITNANTQKPNKISMDTLIAGNNANSTNKRSSANVFAFKESGEVAINDSYSSTHGGRNIIALIHSGGTSSQPKTEGMQLLLKDKKINNESILENHSKQYKQANGNTLLKVKVERGNNTQAHNFTIKGLAVGDITKITKPITSATLTLDTNSAFVGKIDLINNTPAKPSVTLDATTMQQGSKLIFENENLHIKSFTLNGAPIQRSQLSSHTLAQNNTIVDMVSLDREKNREFRLLTIGDKNNTNDKGFVGENGLFRIFYNQTDLIDRKLGGMSASSGFNTNGEAYSDRIVIHNGSGGKQFVQVFYDPSQTDVSKVGYQGGGTEKEGNIAVATVKKDTGIKFEAKGQLQGYDVIGTFLESVETDEHGKTKNSNGGDIADKNYTTYFIKSIENAGASLANQKVASVALGKNYELYLANLNSLNKRMGELRENAGAQGVWARIFNGMQTLNFKEALQTRSIYTTIQAGYDYTFGFKGASNYLGLALSYANTLGSSKGMQDINGQVKGLKNTNSNAIEFAIYNAYVQDGASKATGWKNGLYTDSIVKFSYIMSNLTFMDQVNQTYKTDNLAFSFSQEVGYRFLLGNDREFYIDPQAEITLGFFSDSNLTQRMGKDFYLKALQDSIFTLRSRIGSSYGYKFDKFTQNKGFNSSLYLGTYFVSDAIVGGNVSIVTNSDKGFSSNPLESDMRFVLNLGTNFKIKDNTRIYFDFERSFGGKITTDYQLNLGVRYSFGTSAYTPHNETIAQEVKDTSVTREIEPTKGYYIELLEKEVNTLSNKEKKVLEKLKDNLKVQSKTQGNKTMKIYLAGPYKDESKAKEAKSKLEGIIKELKSKGNVIEVE